MQYFTKRVLRLTATPHAVAAGVAAGVFASFMPYLGFHFIIAAVAAYCLRGNLLASALGTAIGNPLTFPFIWAASLALGRLILYGRQPEGIVPLQLGRVLSELQFAHLWEPLLKPMTLGGAVLGTLFGVTFYLVTYWAISMFRTRRKVRLAERARRRAQLVATQA